MNEKKILNYHKKKPVGKIEIETTKPLGVDELNIAYTPGVSIVSKEISKDPKKVYDYTWKSNSVAIISDGSAVLGSGNLGPEASLPVLEGKSMLLKRLAGVDAVPIAVNKKSSDDIIDFVKGLVPSFGAIMLEDISSPRCFEIEEELQNVGVPVFHDDQHATAIAVLAALINACKVTEKDIREIDIVLTGAGAAGIATVKLLNKYLEKREGDIIICDSKGMLYPGRENMDKHKQEIAEITNRGERRGELKHAIRKADVFIGLSRGGILTKDMIETMNKDPIIFALANPVPEVMPGQAEEAGASVVATGRSDFDNQINNALVFPGLFKGFLKARANKVTKDILIEAAEALASSINPTKSHILPKLLDRKHVDKVADAVRSAYHERVKT